MSDIRAAVHSAAKKQLRGLFNNETAEKIATSIAEDAEEPVLEAVVKTLRAGANKPAKPKKKKGGTRRPRQPEEPKPDAPPAAETKPAPEPEPEKKDEAPAAPSGGEAMDLI